ncbi:MAG: 50S ribosomal protein L10 [Eggerthellaceae bacterium]
MGVYKNTLMRLALENAELPELGDILSGPSAFVFATGDPVASQRPSRTSLSRTRIWSSGRHDGRRRLRRAEVEAIAALPSREELIAKLLGTISNPMVKMVRVCNGPMEYFARAVSAIADQKSAA